MNECVRASSHVHASNRTERATPIGNRNPAGVTWTRIDPVERTDGRTDAPVVKHGKRE